MATARESNTTEVLNAVKGLRIETVRLGAERLDSDPELRIVFSDDSQLVFRDDMRLATERRYMSCDDDLGSFTGETVAMFYTARLSQEKTSMTDSDERDYDENTHDIQFLHVRLTSEAAITCQTHNLHNGFYSGFDVVVTYLPSDGSSPLEVFSLKHLPDHGGE